MRPFTVKKHLPDGFGSIDFLGFVFNDNPEDYEIKRVIFNAPIKGMQITCSEDITLWFHTFRALTDPQFHHSDIVELLVEWLKEDAENEQITNEEFFSFFDGLKSAA